MSQKTTLGAALAVAAALLAPRATRAEEPKAPPKEEAKKGLEIGTKVGQKIPQIRAALWDLSGKEPVKSAFDGHSTDKPTAYFFVSGACSWCGKYLERMTAALTNGHASGARTMQAPSPRSASRWRLARTRPRGPGWRPPSRRPPPRSWPTPPKATTASTPTSSRSTPPSWSWGSA